MPDQHRELWLLAGQSNMEGQGDLVDGPAPHPRVRAFTLARRWEPAREPLHRSAESPARKGVGPGLWFARQRADQTGRPIDLVCAAHGGTSLSQWLPRSSAPVGTNLYDSMVESLRQAGGPLTGVLWYQGCNDTNPDDAAAYLDRMKTLVEALRYDLGQPDLPWLVAQLGRTVGRQDDVESWNRIREAQAGLPDRIPRLAVVSTVDLELDDWIHLSARAQETLANRFVDAARCLVDHAPDTSPVPRPTTALWDPEGTGEWVVRVDFDHVVGGWSVAGLPRGFTLVDTQGRDRGLVVRTRVEGSSVFLRTSTDDLAGLTVAYAEGTDPVANLVDARGQGLLAFRRLAIAGLPPVTPWVRDWSLHWLPLAELAALKVPDPSSMGWVSHSVTGWWYLVLTDWWDLGAVAGRTWFLTNQTHEVEIRVGNDVPFRLWVDGRLLVEEDLCSRLTSINIDLEHHRPTLRLEAGVHEVAFVARPRPDGGLGLDLRFATAPDLPLPELLDHQRRRFSP